MVVIGNKNGTRGYLFVSLPSDDVSYGSTPSPPYTLPRARIRPLRPRAHCPPPYFLDVQSHAHTNTRTHWSSPPFPFSLLTVAGQGEKGGEVGQRPCSSPALLCNLHLRAFDNLEQSVLNLLQILDRLLSGHVQSLM